MIKRMTALSLASILVLSQTARAEEEAHLEELEITLEIFEDSEQLEAFELHLIDPEQPSASEDFPTHDALEERMDRFEEEVAVRERDGRVEEPGEDPAEKTEREHEGDRLSEIAEADSADEMDELDLAEEREPEEPEEPEEHEGESEADEQTSADQMSDEVIDDDLVLQPESEADAMEDDVDGLVG